MGLLWQRFRAEFPKTQDHPPRPRIIETFDGPNINSPPFRIEALARPPLARILFLNSDETELVQVQGDRLIHNWRKVGTEETYPRYDKYIKRRFERDLQQYADFVAEGGLGALTAQSRLAAKAEEPSADPI